MAELLYNFAQVSLFLYCLMPTDIESVPTSKVKPLKFNEKEIAIVNATSGGTPCLAVWISENFLLTAASCFDEMGKRNFTENPDIDVIITRWRLYKTKFEYHYRGEKNNDKGEAIVHPRFERKDKLTFTYDLAVVRADEKITKYLWHDDQKINLCSVDSKVSQWDVYSEPSSKESHRFCRRTINQTEPRYFAVDIKTEQVYYIDPRKQFTAYIEQRELPCPISHHLLTDTDKRVFAREFTEQGAHAFPIGGPVFDTKKSCVAGIVNFVGERHDKLYITSTKVYPVRKWIEFTMQYLKKARDKREGVKIYGTEGKKFWKKKKINLDPIGPSNENERQAGNTLSNTDWNELVRREQSRG